MKKISLSVLAIVFAGASIFAIGHVPAKKAQATCHTCTKGNCTKTASCTNQANCVCK
jgi:hypothetical protein